MAQPPELACVLSCQGLLVAGIYKSKLEAADIPVLLQYDSAGMIYGITVDGLGQVRIMVPVEFAAEAEALLQERQTPEPGESADYTPGEVEAAT